MALIVNSNNGEAVLLLKFKHLLNHAKKEMYNYENEIAKK